MAFIYFTINYLTLFSILSACRDYMQSLLLISRFKVVYIFKNENLVTVILQIVRKHLL